MLVNTCKICKIEFVKPNNPKRAYKYCSCKCMGLDKEKTQKHGEKMKGKIAWNKGDIGRKEWHNTEGLKPGWNKGMTGIYTEEVLEKNRIAHLGKEPGNKGCKSSEETKNKLSKAKIGKYGELSGGWKGGLTTQNKLARDRIEYHIWRKAVFERDNFTCKKYGIYGGKLEAHHINNFSEFVELRTSIQNGITLSKQAHKEFHKKYGRTNNTIEQLIEFLNQEA